MNRQVNRGRGREMQSNRRTTNAASEVEQPKIDRSKTCPFLVRLFVACHEETHSSHRSTTAYEKGKVPESGEVHLYTWSDATLKELTGCIQEVEEAARHPRAVVSFAVVYPNQNGVMSVRPIGKVFNRNTSSADSRTLGSCNFHAGDYLDISINRIKQRMRMRSDRMSPSSSVRSNDLKIDRDNGRGRDRDISSRNKWNKNDRGPEGRFNSKSRTSNKRPNNRSRTAFDFNGGRPERSNDFLRR